MNAKELIDTLEENGPQRSFWNYLEGFRVDSPDFPKRGDNLTDQQIEQYWEDLEEFQKKFWQELGVGEFEQVDRYGGEGEGNSAWSVIHFIDLNIYLKWEGSYASYHGFDWDYPPTEVKPKTKQITVFE